MNLEEAENYVDAEVSPQESTFKITWCHSSRYRLLLAAFSGLLMMLLQPHGWPLALCMMNSWSVGAACYLILTRILVLQCNAEQTRYLSMREEEAGFTVDTLPVIGCLASVAEIVMTVGLAEHAKGNLAFWLTAAAVLSFVLSWILVHTVYAMHYARLYYHDGHKGGVTFHLDDGDPTYMDFCTLSFAIAISVGPDITEVPGRAFRRTIIRHSILSFVFATIILGIAMSMFTTWL
jgi:uncharacterized membrane protein